MSWFVLLCIAVAGGGLALVWWAGAETPAERWAAHHPAAEREAVEVQPYDPEATVAIPVAQLLSDATVPLRTVQPRGGGAA